MCYIFCGDDMNLQFNRTNDGITTYPLHCHADYEIIYYLKGEGVLKTENKDIAFAPGTIIIVPPMFVHGSSSYEGFLNFCINGDFENLLNFKEPIVMQDNEKNEGWAMVELLFNNRFSDNKDFLWSLCKAYILFLLSSLKIDDNMDSVINEIIMQISNNACDCDFNPAVILKKSGYAEDYIRNRFKLKTGKTPIRFLTEIRIKHACYLIEIYKKDCSLVKIAEQCGFVDYIYFSKRFKQVIGVSPNQYKKQLF